MQLVRDISAAIAADKEPVRSEFRAHPLPGAVSEAAARPVGRWLRGGSAGCPRFGERLLRPHPKR